MSSEARFIAALRGLATDASARGLLDDAAVLEMGDARLVLTHDAIVEGVHFRRDDPPGDVAWKLVAVNLSDLAAKGAAPNGVLLGYALRDDKWDQSFVLGLGQALAAFDCPLLGGDTVAAPSDTPRTLSLTAIGRAQADIPSRAGAKANDELYVSGTIGDAGAGLALLDRGARDDVLVRRYRAPRPRLEAGQALAPLVSAMMDVSDGLLIDASRLGHASGAGVTIALDAVPLSQAYAAAMGDDRAARLRAATAGDDYELLFAAPPDRRHEITALADRLGLPLTRIGRLEEGAGLTLTDGGSPVPLPSRLGWEHG